MPSDHSAGPPASCRPEIHPPQDLAADRAARAAIFADPDVVACYASRAPYAPALFDFLCELPARRDRALDIGCGPGNVARGLADRFAEVVALDPSAPMIEAAKRADSRPNLCWTLARAEDFDTDVPFDLVTAGASIHWTNPEILFPKLARWTPLVAILSNDPTFPHPPPPCGHDAWIAFLEEWFARTGRCIPEHWRAPDPDAPAPLGPHGDWLDIQGRKTFHFTFSQTVEAFVASNHSRVNWRRAVLSRAQAKEFDAALTALMRPFAAEGRLEVQVVSELVWGRARAERRP
ncbi:MAG TPA: class I SAM-dependent methyltransferase [Caulobacteraceae bacterium]|jgi:SAM-dependent methyltransferase